MFVMPSAPRPEVPPSRAPVLAALVYPEDKYPAQAFEALVQSCRRRGMSLAGVLQHLTDAGPNRRCDVVLEDLATGHRTAIFEDRGANAAGSTRPHLPRRRRESRPAWKVHRICSC